MTRREDPASFRVVAVLLASALVLVVAGTGIGAFASGAALPGVGSTGDAASDAQIDPADVESEEDLSAVERQLAARAAERIRSGAVEVSEGDVERAREAIGDEEFETLVDQYGAVANETGDRSRAQTINRIQRLQLRYTSKVARYRTAYSQYLVLKRSAEAGKTSRGDVRRQARQMGTIARNVDDVATRLLESYRTLPDNDSADSRNATAAIRDTRAEITRTQAAVRQAEFVPTRIRITSATERIGFTRPFRLRGRLTTANGTAVANETVTVHILEANRSITTTTTGTGAFAFEYRPTRLPRDTSELTLRYDPAAGTAYAGNRTSVDVTVEQAVPTVTLSRRSQTVAYNETLVVAGRVAANGTGVPAAPYVATLGTGLVVRGTTDAEGRFVVRERIPPGISAGERRIEVVFPFGNRTLATVSGSTNVTVRSQPTRLSLSTESVDGRVVRVSGRLSTNGGEPIGGEPVRLEVATRAFGTVTTDRQGRFSTTLTVPDGALGSGLLDRRSRVRIEAAYESSGALESSRRTATVTVTEPVPWFWLGGGLLAAVLAGIGYLLRARGPWGEWGSSGGETESGASGSTASESLDTSPADTESLLGSAREQLSAGRSSVAIALGYEALRRGLEPQVAAEDARAWTHWEFYRACRERDVDEAAMETLAAMTELYERAAFAGQPIDEGTVRASLDQVGSVAGVGDARVDG